MSNILKTLKVPERKSQTKYKEYLAKKKEKEIDRFGTPWNLSWKYWLFFIVIIALYFLISSVTFWKFVIAKVTGTVSHTEL